METTAQETNTYTVPAANIPKLLVQIEKLNKRCRKLRVPEITVTTAMAFVRHEYKTGTGLVWREAGDAVPTTYKPTGRVMAYHTVTVTGAAPKYAGWEFVATLEPVKADGETINLIMTVPGKTCPGTFLRTVGRCDHCNVKRNRRQTFVVRNEAGIYKAVGRQCLKDFLGHTDPNRLAAWAELLASLNGVCDSAGELDWCGGGGGARTYDLEYFLGWVAGAVREHGWVSRTKARETDGFATVDRVMGYLDPGMVIKGMNEADKAAFMAERDASAPKGPDFDEAAKGLAWAEGLDLDVVAAGGNGYLLNVAVVAKAGYVDYKTAGLAGSILAAYHRAEAKAAEVREQAERPESKPVGTVGKRDQYRVRVEKLIPIEGPYGTRVVTRMAAWDDARNCFANDMVWFASGHHDFEEGGVYLVRATVKEHGVYNGRRQTVVARVV